MNKTNKRTMHWGTVAVILAMTLLWVGGPAAHAQSDNTIYVMVSEAVTLAVEDVTKIAVADPAIADFVPLSEKELSIIGKKVGVTTLTIVRTEKPTQIYRVQVGNDAVATTIRKMVDAPGISVRVVGESVILDGQVKDEIDAQRVLQVASVFFKDKVVNLMEIQKPRQIKIQVRVAEVSSAAVRRIGLKWLGDDGTVRYGFLFGGSDNVIDPILHGLVVPTTAQQNYSTDVLLQFLESKGYGRLLSQPTLLTRSGTEASFLAGSEIPIIQTLQNSSTVEYKEVGVRVKIKPVADSQNRINTTIHAEVSQVANEIVRGAGGTELPVILSRKADATLQLNDGQTLVIGGLLDNNIDADTLRKFPWLGDIPVIGALFRHKDRSHTQRELLFFLTPEIVKDVNATTANAAQTPLLKEWTGTATDKVLEVPDKDKDWGLHNPGRMGLPEAPPSSGPDKATGAPTSNFTPARPVGR